MTEDEKSPPPETDSALLWAILIFLLLVGAYYWVSEYWFRWSMPAIGAL